MSKSKKKSEKPKLSKDEPLAKCCKCLKLIPIDEYFDNDHYCDLCASKDGEFRLSSETHFKQWYHEVPDESN